MAKVTWPLLSQDARCSIGRAITFMKRGKVNFVRSIVTPTKKWYKNLGFNQFVFGALSQALGCIQRPWTYYNEFKYLPFNISDWHAQFLTLVRNMWFFSEENLFLLSDDWYNHPFCYAFSIQAEKRGFRDFYGPYYEKFQNGHFYSGFQAYALARTARQIYKENPDIFNFSPYNVGDVSTWSKDMIAEHCLNLSQGPF